MGGLWPIVESYVTGGRRGEELRRVVGWFNVVWSSGVVITSWAMAPLLKTQELALTLMLVTGVAHIATCGLLTLFARYPGKESHESHAHPEVYERLLTVFRLLLPTSYVLMYTLLPLMPSTLERMGVPRDRKTLVLSAFMVARVITFFWLGRWSGWHGRWSMPVWTTALMLVGFATTLLAQGVWWACAGLALFGVGLGGIYTGALYYVMEVGASEVEAGGTHEALIGGGYTLGPILGLLGIWWAGYRDNPAVTEERATVGLALLVAIAGAAVAMAAGARGARRNRL